MEPIAIVFSIISATSAIVSIVCAILARIDKVKAKKSEAAAKEYAENANKANIEIQKYTQYLNVEVDQQQAFNTEKEKVKQHIIDHYAKGKNAMYGITQIYHNMYQDRGDKNLLLNILRDFESDGLICQIKIDGASEFEGFVILRDY